MDIGSLFVPYAQAAKLIKPSEGSFHYPPPPAQAAAMFGVLFREPRINAANS
jgi:hypothetical protein